ncbi:hypothetical protein CJ305_04250 [Leeuwenhoekiella nanhaiensis]|uniref:Uncharacterized protein n=1 Tax=Leeuwenhoekiella nanhaiensis TaxID=1655491 RepID=A0A2G1VTW8_9FLAO|nr:hypothetical protein CJ305_04250 [Leeuwenhoekiella nanhaiensis]
MTEIPNVTCINFELEFIDNSKSDFIGQKIEIFIPRDTPYNLISVSVTLTKESRYLVVAVVQLL